MCKTIHKCSASSTCQTDHTHLVPLWHPTQHISSDLLNCQFWTCMQYTGISALCAGHTTVWEPFAALLPHSSTPVVALLYHNTKSTSSNFITKVCRVMATVVYKPLHLKSEITIMNLHYLPYHVCMLFKSPVKVKCCWLQAQKHLKYSSVEIACKWENKVQFKTCTQKVARW